MLEEDFNPIPLEKKYIEVTYDDETQNRLRDYCNQNGFDLSIKFSGSKQDPEDFDFHSTVWFTTTEHRLQNTSKKTRPFEVKPTGFELFGPKENILVMLVEGGNFIDGKGVDGYDALQQLRDHYELRHGMEDEWPDFRPHITVCYNYDGGIPDVALPDFPLVADTLNIKSQKRS